MRINGAWVGWGLGDWSHNPDGTDRDSTVRRFRSFARRMYARYAGNLADNNKFDQELFDVVVEMQRRLVESNILIPGTFIRGILDLETQYACGFRKRSEKPKPIIFTVEGHGSNMFIGPCAFVASTLEGQGGCHWKPISYNSNVIPFDNPSGCRELVHQLSSDKIEGPPGILWDFGPTVPWGIMGFSQGAMVVCQFMMDSILGPQLNYRLSTFKRGIGFGNPYREQDQIAPWVPDPPRAGTRGIYDVQFNASKTVIAPKWREHSRHGDIYAENTLDEVGLDKTAICKIVTNNSWVGGPAAMLSRVIDLFADPIDGIIDMTQAIMSGGMFAFNAGPHGQYDLNPCIEWMRGVKT